MNNAVWFISYNLKKNASEADFLLALEQCNNEVLSKQKGFISWTVLRDGDTWVDLVTWETPEDAKKAETAGQSNSAAKKFYSFIDFKSLKQKLYSREKNF